MLSAPIILLLVAIAYALGQLFRSKPEVQSGRATSSIHRLYFQHQIPIRGRKPTMIRLAPANTFWGPVLKRSG